MFDCFVLFCFTSFPLPPSLSCFFDFCRDDLMKKIHMSDFRDLYKISEKKISCFLSRSASASINVSFIYYFLVSRYGWQEGRNPEILVNLQLIMLMNYNFDYLGNWNLHYLMNLKLILLCKDQRKKKDFPSKSF